MLFLIFFFSTCSIGYWVRVLKYLTVIIDLSISYSSINFAFLVFFYWMVNIVSFTLLSIKYFYNSITIFVFFFPGVNKLLGKSFIPSNLAFMFVKFIWNNAQSRASYFPLLRQDFLEYTTHEWWIFPICLVKQALFLAWYECHVLFHLILLDDSFSGLDKFPHTCAH